MPEVESLEITVKLTSAEARILTDAWASASFYETKQILILGMDYSDIKVCDEIMDKIKELL